MEQPTLSAPKNDTPSKRQQQRPPTPEELVAIYESQGLDSGEASLKAIADLQAVLYRTIAATRGKNGRTATTDTVRKLDNINTRLAILDMKLDAKPGYPESLAIGVASGAALSAFPHVLGALGNIWNAVKNAVKNPSSSP